MSWSELKVPSPYRRATIWDGDKCPNDYGPPDRSSPQVSSEERAQRELEWRAWLDELAEMSEEELAKIIY